MDVVSRAQEARRQLAELMSEMFYDHTNAVTDHVVDLLTQTTSVRPVREVFRDSNTKQKVSLLSLEGEVPVQSGALTFPVPVKIALRKSYPSEAPICFVVPKPGTTLVRDHPHLDHRGRVVMEYLMQWAPDSSDLVGVVFCLQDTFASCLPIAMEAVQVVAPSPQMQRQQPDEVVATQPVSDSAQQRRRGSAPVVSSNPPPLASALHSFSEAMLPVPAAARLSPAPDSASSSPFSSPPPSPPPEASLTSSFGLRTVPTPAEARDLLRQQLSEHKTAWLAQVERAMHREARVHAALEKRKRLLDADLLAAKQERDDLNYNLRALESAGKQVDAIVARAGQGRVDDIDGFIAPADAVSAQLLDLVSTDNAITDLCYYLDKALELQVIDVDQWLRVTRQLSKEQYAVRALTLKILS